MLNTVPKIILFALIIFRTKKVLGVVNWSRASATLAVSREVPMTKELLPYFTETQGMTWILSKGMVKCFESQHGSQYTIAFLAHFVVKIMTIS